MLKVLARLLFCASIGKLIAFVSTEWRDAISIVPKKSKCSIYIHRIVMRKMFEKMCSHAHELDSSLKAEKKFCERNVDKKQERRREILRNSIQFDTTPFKLVSELPFGQRSDEINFSIIWISVSIACMSAISNRTLNYRSAGRSRYWEEQWKRNRTCMIADTCKLSRAKREKRAFEEPPSIHGSRNWESFTFAHIRNGGKPANNIKIALTLLSSNNLYFLRSCVDVRHFSLQIWIRNGPLPFYFFPYSLRFSLSFYYSQTPLCNMDKWILNHLTFIQFGILVSAHIGPQFYLSFSTKAWPHFKPIQIGFDRFRQRVGRGIPFNQAAETLWR